MGHSRGGEFVLQFAVLFLIFIAIEKGRNVAESRNVDEKFSL